MGKFWLVRDKSGVPAYVISAKDENLLRRAVLRKHDRDTLSEEYEFIEDHGSDLRTSRARAAQLQDLYKIEYRPLTKYVNERHVVYQLQAGSELLCVFIGKETSMVDMVMNRYHPCLELLIAHQDLGRPALRTVKVSGHERREVALEHAQDAVVALRPIVRRVLSA
jgi:hypothetical protein